MKMGESDKLLGLRDPVLRGTRFVFVLLLCTLLCTSAQAQSLYPNADSEAIYNRTISQLNAGKITSGQASRIFLRLLENVNVPSTRVLDVYGAHIWKLAVQKESAYLHRVTESAVAAAIEDALGCEAASSAWAQQLKYANIHKEATVRLQRALK
jgi:hypothetical protein